MFPKPQFIRFPIDVLVIGPLMIWGGLESRKSNQVLGSALVVSGVLTIVYNGLNYLKIQRGDGESG